jgi:hypothetical protein
MVFASVVKAAAGGVNGAVYRGTFEILTSSMLPDQSKVLSEPYPPTPIWELVLPPTGDEDTAADTASAPSTQSATAPAVMTRAQW